MELSACARFKVSSYIHGYWAQGMGLMTTATFAVPEAQWAEPNNLQVYMQQVIGQQGLGNSELSIVIIKM